MPPADMHAFLAPNKPSCPPRSAHYAACVCVQMGARLHACLMHASMRT